MRKVEIGDRQLTLSRLGFGTSRLFNIRSPEQRQRLLFAAYDHGFTHFDTAPLYGFGTAERELRSLLAARPDVTIATKVGLYPPGGGDQGPNSVLFRKAAGKFVPALSKPQVDWSVKRAQASLSASLRRLGREQVDLYLLHEPEVDLLDTHEWRTWLEAAGDRVKCFGVAGEASRIAGFLTTGNPLARVVQCSDSIRDKDADVVIRTKGRLHITYGYLSSASRDPGATVETMFLAGLARNHQGCVLVSTSKEARIQRLAELVEQSEAALAVPPPPSSAQEAVHGS